MQDYNHLDQHLHLLCQLPARVTASLLPETADYSHTNLLFDDVGLRIMSRGIPNGASMTSLAIDLKKMTFDWLDASMHVVVSHPIPGHNLVQLQKMLTDDLADLNFKQKNLDVPLKYEIPDYPFRGDAFRNPPAPAMEKWAFYRSLANTSGSAFYHHLGHCGQVRIWPHHFDTGVYHAPTDKIGIGFGLAMYDDMVKAPYFYLSGYALQGGEITMHKLPKLKFGEWKTGNWNGAVLPLPLLEKTNEANRQDMVFTFITEAIKWYRKSYF